MYFWILDSVPFVYVSVLCFQSVFVLIIVALQYSLKSGNVISSTFFFLKIALVIQVCVCVFHINFRIFFYLCKNCYWKIHKSCIDSIDGFG